MSIKETKDGALLPIFVKPNSSKFKIAIEGDEVVVYSTEEPEKGKVNKEIIKELTRTLKFDVRLVSGLTSKQKVVLFSGASKLRVEQALANLGKECKGS